MIWEPASREAGKGSMEDAREMAETGGRRGRLWAVGFGSLGWLALYFFWVWLCCAGALAAACCLWPVVWALLRPRPSVPDAHAGSVISSQYWCRVGSAAQRRYQKLQETASLPYYRLFDIFDMKFDHSSYLKFFYTNIVKLKLFLKNLY